MPRRPRSTSPSGSAAAASSRLYRAFNDEELPGRTGPVATRRAVRRTLGVSLNRLDDDVKGSLGG